MRLRQRNIFHKVLYILTVFVFVLPGLSAASGYAQGLETLAGKVSNSILDYFTAKGESDIRFSITKFENFSGITDLAAHKFYQQLAARLEGRPQALFNDLMIDFSQKKGEFNLNRIDRLDYLIYLKLIKKLDKVGAGIAVFSRSLDKIVYIKYFEEDFSPGESNIYETVDYGFKGLGFSRQIEIDAEKNLLDFKGMTNPTGEPGDLYLFFYPGEIEIFKTRDNQFKKVFSFKLEWGRPYYPVMDYEGRLCVFYRVGDDGGPVLYVTAGSNFSPRSKVLSYQNNQWQEIGVLDFVPIKAIRLNNSDYLAGAIYDEGKNYFKDKLILVPFTSGKLDMQNLLEKKVVPFFALDFSIPSQPSRGAEAGENVDGVHLIDSDYNHRFYAGDFQERGPSFEKRGSALAALDGQWLALSDYSFSTQKDKLYFYKIEAGSKQAVYENTINGQVTFISTGSWQEHHGFWVYVEEIRNDSPVYRLQFWSKNMDKEEGNN
ncbi:MAG: hypothetical protein QG657_122 [Acidobacteriota bacterium]|nr:hypothetical protein [Acidobacteriota bacterium]